MLSPTLRGARRSQEIRWALSDISFTLQRGGSIGVIGHNGAGKSTLLRLASGLTRPTRGSLLVTPSTASVLSLGATFNADLSGSANAITAAVIGGLTPAQARAALPRALEFAELDGFEEAPVRSYSDGMKLRLAFGVITLMTPELLILDEVLAVGDVGFQQKCMEHLEMLKQRGTSIVLASHDLQTIVEQCDRALLIEHGAMRALGDPASVTEQYRLAMQTETIRLTPEELAAQTDRLVLQKSRFGSQEMQIARVAIGPPAALAEVPFGGRLEVTVTVGPNPRREQIAVSVAIVRATDDVKCIDLNTEMDGALSAAPSGDPVTIALRLDELELRPGKYWVDVGLFPVSWAHAYDYHWQVYELTVTGVRDDEGTPVYRPQQRRWTIDGPGEPA